MAQRWYAYVDESGTFDDGSDTVFVGGLFHAAGALHEPRLRHDLEAAAPEVPWPLHRWVTCRPSAWAIWAHAAFVAKTATPVAWRTAVAAHAVMMAQGPAELSQATDCLLAPKSHAKLYGWLRSLDAILQGAGLHDAFLDRRRAFEVAFARALRSATLGQVAAFGFTDHPSGSTGQQYERILGTTFNRALEAGAFLSREAELQLVVLRRDVIHPVMGVRTANSTPTLNQLLASRIAAGRLTRAFGRTRLVSAEVRSFDPQVGVGEVVADFVAGLLRAELHRRRKAPPGLQSLSRSSQQSGTPPLLLSGSAGTVWLPLVGEDGPAERAIDERRAGHPYSSPAGVPLWSREQADAWGTLL